MRQKNFDEGKISYYREILANAEQLRFMNMLVLAQVIEFIEINTENIFDNLKIGEISKYINILMSTMRKNEKKELSDDEHQLVELRLIVTFIRYFNYIYIIINPEETTIQE